VYHVAVPAPGRLLEIAALPHAAGFRRAVHLDRRGAAPRPVVLSFAPPELADAPARLAALARDAEAAARVHHPNVVPALGLATLDDAVALSEAHVDGAILEALLADGGRLPPDVAARIVCDAGAGLAALHATDAGDGQLLVHGALTAAWLVVGADGVTRVGGAGAAAGSGAIAADDVRALAGILHRCLTGEPPADPARPLDGPGLPRELAVVVDRALGAIPGDRPASAAALVAEISGAIPPAPSEHVAAYLEAILPADAGERADLARRLAATETAGAEEARAADADELIVVDDEVSAPAWAVATADVIQDVNGDGTGNVGTAVAATSAMAVAATSVANPTATANASPTATPNANASATPNAIAGESSPPSPPPPDAAVTFAAPAPAPVRSRLPLVVGLVAATSGFAAGVALTRMYAPGAPPAVVAPAETAAGPDRTPERRPEPTRSPAPTAAARPAPAPADAAPAAPAATADEVPPPRSPSRPAKAAPSRVRTPPTPARLEVGRGVLTVNAPPDAEVLVDGKLAGRGSVRVDLREGGHRVEVRRGDARVGERFTLHAGETYTYDVTPTP
jgi:eukaryotic-like serine/threonine-protein kinase